MVPSDGGIRPASILTVVDLPDPFGPRYPSTSPGRTVKLTLRTAVMAPYRLVTLRTSRVCISVCRVRTFSCSAQLQTTIHERLEISFLALQRRPRSFEALIFNLFDLGVGEPMPRGGFASAAAGHVAAGRAVARRQLRRRHASVRPDVFPSRGCSAVGMGVAHDGTYRCEALRPRGVIQGATSRHRREKRLHLRGTRAFFATVSGHSCSTARRIVLSC